MTAAATGRGMVGVVSRNRVAVFLGLLQLAFIVLFSLTAHYRPHDAPRGIQHPAYNGFQDAHLGIVVGLGLLLCFLKRYAVTGLGFSLLLVAIVLQWAVFVQQVFLTRGTAVIVDITSLLMGDFAAMAVLVTLGVVVGKLSAIQLVFLALFEVVFVAINHYIGFLLFQASDSGWAMYTHVFGAFFGLAVSRLTHQQHHIDHPQASATYQSDVVTILGTLFLWICFPGLNAALAPGETGDVAVVNTVLALGAATVSTFALTVFFHPEERFSVLHLQNAVLAGGVGIGTTAHMMMRPYAALLIGVAAAFVSTFGFRFIQPFVEKRVKATDTRGVLSVHGLPGVLGALASILVAGFANFQQYNMALYEVFPAMVAVNSSMSTNNAVTELVEAGSLAWGSGRSPWSQAGVQAVTLAVSIAIALFGGAFTGFLLSLRCFHQLTAEEVFDDAAFWDMNKEGLPAYTVYVPPPAPEPKEEEVELKPKEEEKEEEKKEEKKEEKE